MEVTFRNSFWDMLRFNLGLPFRTRSSQIVLGVLALAVGYFVFSIPDDPPFSLIFKVLAFVIILIVLLFALLALISIALGFVYITSATQRQQVKLDRKLSISDNGVVTESAIGRSETKWSAIVNIRQNRDYILIYLSERQAWVLPKRAFAQSTDAEKFLNNANELWDRAKNSVSLQ